MFSKISGVADLETASTSIFPLLFVSWTVSTEKQYWLIVQEIFLWCNFWISPFTIIVISSGNNYQVLLTSTLFDCVFVEKINFLIANALALRILSAVSYPSSTALISSSNLVLVSSIFVYKVVCALSNSILAASIASFNFPTSYVFSFSTASLNSCKFFSACALFTSII
jgi:hypothetical protein